MIISQPYQVGGKQTGDQFLLGVGGYPHKYTQVVNEMTARRDRSVALLVQMG
jgi:hypothetical protein